MISKRRLLVSTLGLIAAPAVIGRAAAQAPTIELGRYWKVIEASAARADLIWNGTWTRRPGTKVFDAYWRVDKTGEEVSDVIEFLEQRGDAVSLFRRQLNGRYNGRVLASGRHLSGSATWYGNGDHWTAEIFAG